MTSVAASSAVVPFHDSSRRSRLVKVGAWLLGDLIVVIVEGSTLREKSEKRAARAESGRGLLRHRHAEDGSSSANGGGKPDA